MFARGGSLPQSPLLTNKLASSGVRAGEVRKETKRALVCDLRTALAFVRDCERSHWVWRECGWLTGENSTRLNDDRRTSTGAAAAACAWHRDVAYSRVAI